MSCILSHWKVYRILRGKFPRFTAGLYRAFSVRIPLPPQRHPIQPYTVSGNAVKTDYGPCMCGCGATRPRGEVEGVGRA